MYVAIFKLRVIIHRAHRSIDGSVQVVRVESEVRIPIGIDDRTNTQTKKWAMHKDEAVGERCIREEANGRRIAEEPSQVVG